MGYPGKSRKSYDTPKHPWQEARIAEEVELIKNYGLRNKREVWKAASILRRYRRDSRRLLAETASGEISEHTKSEIEGILGRFKKLGLLKENANLDDILILKTADILERRLQTQVYRQGFANSMKQARQFITHGHIAVEQRRITIPSYLVLKKQESQISYYEGSPLSKESHPAIPIKSE